MNPRFLAPLLAFLTIPSAASAQNADRKDRLTLDLYLEWEQVQDPQISPDGRQVVYARRWVDKLNDDWKSSLWIVNADGSRNRFLTEGSSPRWSPDGTRIAFVRDGEPRGNQIFVRWMDAEGATTQITRVEKAPATITWSPDGQSIAFTMLVTQRQEWKISLPARPQGAKWTEDPRIVTWLDYRQDGQGFTDEGFRQVFVVPAGGGTPRQLTEGGWDHANPQWTPDRTEILFSSNRVPEAEYDWRESNIYAVNVASGTIRQLTRRRGPDSDPNISPDGKQVAYTGYDWTDDSYITSRMYVMGIDGSNPRELLGGLDRSPADIEWASDNTGLYFTTEESGTSNVYFAPLAGKPRKLTNGNQILRVSSMARNGLVAGTITSPHAPVDVVVFDITKPQTAIKPVTDVNSDVLAGRKLGAVEEIWYNSVDNYKVQGWIIKPPDFDASRKYPLILSIHGGPHSMYNVGFNFGWQEHAAQGYVVLYTNPRGSTGYGSAFGNAIKNAYPGKDHDDLMAGVDTVIGRGYIDPKNLFIYGCSGGGVLTAWAVGHTDRFTAAASLCPVINWISFVGTTDGPSWYRNFAKPPWEDASEYLRRSPLMYVGNVKTPTLLMTGVLDLRTPIPQTEEFYEALKYRKVPTAMIRMNNEWHGTSSKPSNFMRTQLYVRGWFEKYASKEKVSAAPTP